MAMAIAMDMFNGIADAVADVYESEHHIPSILHTYAILSQTRTETQRDLQKESLSMAYPPGTRIKHRLAFFVSLGVSRMWMG